MQREKTRQTPEPKRITAPLTPEIVAALKVGERVTISGTIYTARDAAHMKLCKAIALGSANNGGTLALGSANNGGTLALGSAQSGESTTNGGACGKAGDAPALPFDPEGAVIFYAGPAPAPPGKVIGSIGPTTSGRMDSLTEPLLQVGVKGFIGKGERSLAVQQAITRHGAVYFTAIGGIAALLQSCIVSAKVIAYPELGTEAIRELVVQDFPVEVALV